jgi:hypothetical protein
MLIHLPIAIIAAFSPIPVADSVPTLDVAKECRFEGGSSEVFDRCMRDENDARKEVETLWPKVSSADRTVCASEATTGGYASYIELITCLEMARDVAAVEKRDSQSGQPAGSERNR